MASWSVWAVPEAAAASEARSGFTACCREVRIVIGETMNGKKESVYWNGNHKESIKDLKR